MSRRSGARFEFEPYSFVGRILQQLDVMPGFMPGIHVLENSATGKT
jgi:hypothetical protein